MTAVLLGTLVLQAAALLAQAALAGLALGGGGGLALSAHMAVGAASLLLAVIQAGAALLLWRKSRAPSWLFAANLGFLVADAAQAAVCGARLFALHLPLGVALFGAVVALWMRSWELARSRPRSRADFAQAAI